MIVKGLSLESPFYDIIGNSFGITYDIINPPEGCAAACAEQMLCRGIISFPDRMHTVCIGKR